jgi:hypothetical protein
LRIIMRVFPSVAVFAIAACSDPVPTSLHFIEGEVALGQVLCGTSRSGNLTVINTGEAETDVTVVPSLPDVTVTPSFATIAPGDHQVFAVEVAMPRIGTPGWKSRGDLRVMADDTELRVPLTYETAGVSVSPGRYRTIDFGEMRPSPYAGAYGSASLQATAVGAELASVVATVGPPSSPNFEVLTVASNFISLRLAGGEVARRHEGTLPITLTGEGLCSAPQMSIDLVGVVSPNPVLASRTVLDLGQVDACETGWADVTLSNYGPSSTYDATLYDPSGWLSWEGASSGDLHGATVRVRAADNVERPPAGPFDGRVTVSYTGGSKTIPIRGTLLSHTATPSTEYLTLDDVPRGTTVVRKVTVENSGNTVASIEAVGAGATVTPQATQIAPGATRDLWVSFTAKLAAGTEIRSQVSISFGPRCSATEVIKLRGRVVD